MKKNELENTLETIILENGMRTDIRAGFLKLSQNQFGGNPGRGFGELIQNFIDSYPKEISMEDRKGEIETTPFSVSMTDYGQGFTMEKVKLLMTLGGSDKTDDHSKIGQFGIGFFSIFNPSLGTKRVKVTTLLKGHPVQITFKVVADDLPELSFRFLENELNFSTRVEASFKYAGSVRKCINAAREALRYYPCPVTINGEVHQSIWQEAKERGEKIYFEEGMTGFISTQGSGFMYEQNTMKTLCKYEKIMHRAMSGMITGGRNMKGDLRDYAVTETPYLPGYHAVVNNNYLRLTISRDNFYLDSQWDKGVKFLNKMLKETLLMRLRGHLDDMLVLANQFILRNQIKRYLNDPEAFKEKEDSITYELVKVLTEEAAVYRLKDDYAYVSLSELRNQLTGGLPLFFSSEKLNQSWLGGQFKHDFVVLPMECSLFRGAPRFYQILFNTVFDEAIDLDTIQRDHAKLKNLVKRGVVDSDLLSPECKMVGEKQLDEEQQKFLSEVNQLLSEEAIKASIAKNIQIPINEIRATFFEVKDGEMRIATGLLNQEGRPLSEKWVSNIAEKEEKEEVLGLPQDVFLGIRMNHPFIKYLISTGNRYRAYYTLTFLAHELAICQRKLVPDSPFFHFIKERTAKAMRAALMDLMLGDQAQAA